MRKSEITPFLHSVVLPENDESRSLSGAINPAMMGRIFKSPSHEIEFNKESDQIDKDLCVSVSYLRDGAHVTYKEDRNRSSKTASSAFKGTQHATGSNSITIQELQSVVSLNESSHSKKDMLTPQLVDDDDLNSSKQSLHQAPMEIETSIASANADHDHYEKHKVCEAKIHKINGSSAASSSLVFDLKLGAQTLQAQESYFRNNSYSLPAGETF